ncbi:MAG: HD domain-containing protein [Clostridiales bacterium]|nr:HD domain-containing protein [Clostridiales bacterium]
MISEIILKMIEYFNSDVKRISHSLKVYGYAKAITASEGLSDEQKLIIELAAILHDIGIKEAENKYNSSAGKYQEIEGPHIARELMSEIVSPDLIDRISFIIGNHHSYNNIDGIDFQILVESDFLVNIDEDKLDTNSIITIKVKYFKTETGRRILGSLYDV